MEEYYVLPSEIQLIGCSSVTFEVLHMFTSSVCGRGCGLVSSCFQPSFQFLYISTLILEFQLYQLALT